MSARKGRAAKVPARYRGDTPARVSHRRTRGTSQGAQGEGTSSTQGPTETVHPTSEQSNIAAMQQQMRLLQDQLVSVQEAVMDMASATAVATQQPLTAATAISGPAAAVGSAAGSGAAAARCIRAVPDTLVSGVGEAPDQAYPSDMQRFASVPLGKLVDPKVRAKIWAKQYVDLEILVGNTTPQTMLVLDVDSNNPLVQVKDQVTKKIANIEQWSDAFLVYIAIYTEQYPAEVPGILKYMQIVRTMASNSRTNVFLSYDRDFRKLRAHDSMPWSTLHQELFFSLSQQAVTQNATFPLRRQPNPKKQSFPAGYCFSFCSFGRCKNPWCTFKHQCPTCSAPHAMSQCPIRRPTSFPNTQAPNTGARRAAPGIIKRK